MLIKGESACRRVNEIGFAVPVVARGLAEQPFANEDAADHGERLVVVYETREVAKEPVCSSGRTGNHDQIAMARHGVGGIGNQTGR